MVQRQLPKIPELLELMQFKKPELDGTKRRLEGALTIADLRTIAKRRTPKAAFDYTDGAAEGELSLARARRAFEDVEFHPDILRPAANVDTSVEILGGRSALPFGIAPTGFTRLMQTEGEIAGAGAAEPPASRSRSRPSARPPSRTCAPRTRTDATGSSSTSCGTGRSPTASWSGRRRPDSTRSCSRSTRPSRARGCATSATASRSRRSSPSARS
jgi:hypothetical protein